MIISSFLCIVIGSCLMIDLEPHLHATSQPGVHDQCATLKIKSGNGVYRDEGNNYTSLFY